MFACLSVRLSRVALDCKRDSFVYLTNQGQTGSLSLVGQLNTRRHAQREVLAFAIRVCGLLRMLTLHVPGMFVRDGILAPTPRPPSAGRHQSDDVDRKHKQSVLTAHHLCWHKLLQRMFCRLAYV